MDIDLNIKIIWKRNETFVGWSFLSVVNLFIKKEKLFVEPEGIEQNNWEESRNTVFTFYYWIWWNYILSVFLCRRKKKLGEYVSSFAAI